MKRLLLCAIVVCCINTILAQVPTISSFSPNSGAVGSTVVISGTNFNTTPTNNIAFLGGVKATVTAATDTSLTVTVPVGANYQPISVTVNKLTGYSTNPFVTSFAGNGIGFSSATFGSAQLVPNNLYGFAIATGDLDGDGKADVVTVDLADTAISVFQNKSTPAFVSFAAQKNYKTGIHPGFIAISDLNGDGKPDVVVTNENDGSVSVYKNTSTGTNISLAAKADFAASRVPIDIKVGDIDNDGKPDLIVVNAQDNYISVLRNTSTNDSISFAYPVRFSTGDYPNFCIVNDMDGDGKPDVIVANYGDYSITTLRNTSVPGTISFDQSVPELVLATGAVTLAVGDLNGDNKPDLVLINLRHNYGVHIMKNTSLVGNITFAQQDIDMTSQPPSLIAIGDLDGDGRPEIITANGNRTNVSVLQNQCTANSIAFAPFITYASGAAFNTALAIQDIDGDGKPDIINTSTTDNDFAVLINTQVPNCTSSDIAFTSNLAGTAYQWQVNTGMGYTNITNGSAYTGATTSTLHLIAPPTVWYGYLYRCIVTGAGTSNETILKFGEQWTGAINTAWETAGNWSCGKVPDAYTDVIIPTITDNSVVLSSNQSVHSLTTYPGVDLTIKTPFTLTITGK